MFARRKTTPASAFPCDKEGLAKKTAAQARREFDQRFGLGLQDLMELFDNQGWRDSARGGNQWANIARAVVELDAALDRSEFALARDLLVLLREMRHNTGLVGSKLRELDRSLR